MEEICRSIKDHIRGIEDKEEEKRRMFKSEIKVKTYYKHSSSPKIYLQLLPSITNLTKNDVKKWFALPPFDLLE